MENVKNMKIIAVDTSLGTNFLLSICEDATVSELRGMIQKEHISCFPELESVNVGALLVDYNQRQYCLTDRLLVGQVFRKCWNKIHAVVSSGSVRAGLFSNYPKLNEKKGCVDGKTGIPGGSSLDKRQLVGHPEALLNAERKESSAEKQSSSDEAPSRLCQTKASDGYITAAPGMMVNQDCWIDLKNSMCPLFSIEAPYTQPLSELEVIVRADATNKGHLGTKIKRKRGRCVEEEISAAEMQKQGKVDCEDLFESVRDKDSTPDHVNVSRTEEDRQTKVCEETLESHQPYTVRQEGLNGKVILSTGEEHPSNAWEAPNNGNIHQHTGGPDNNIERGRGQREILLSSNTEAFMSSPGRPNLAAVILESHHNSPKRATEEAGSCEVQKKVLESSWKEKDCTKGCPEVSAGNLQEGTEEANFNDEAQIHQLDLSMGYPIKINDHTVLLVASLSADIVPETQESQMESQDCINQGDEGAAVEPLHDECLKPNTYPEVDLVEHKEMEPLILPVHQDARNRSSQELIDQVEDLAVLVEKEEKTKLKPLVTDQPSKNLSPEETHEVTKTGTLFDEHHNHETQLLDAGDSHNIFVRGIKKKYRRRKVSEIDQNWKQKDDDRLVGSNIEEQGVQGDVDRLMDLNNEEEDVQEGVDNQKLMDENAQSMENVVETNNGKLQTVNQSIVEGASDKVDINKGTSDDIDLRSRDPSSSRFELKGRKVSRKGHHKKRKKQSVGSRNERSPFAGEHTTESQKVVIEATEDGGKSLEGSSIGGQSTSGQEKLCNKDGEGKESDKIRRKKKKRRKETSRPIGDGHNSVGIDGIHSGGEGALVDEYVENNGEYELRPFKIKELPNVARFVAVEEDDLNQDGKNLDGDVGCEKVAKKKSKRKKRVDMETDFEMCYTQEERDENRNVNDTESPAVKDDIIKSPPPVSPPSKDPSQEDLDTFKQGLDVFEFESSETADRQKENFAHLEGASNLDADNLDKLCSAAVNIVEEEILSPSKMATRKTSRKSVHPKRWVTVLSERLTWNQASKGSSKKQRADKKRGHRAKSTRPVEEIDSDGDIVSEASDAEEEAREGSSQVIIDDERVACPLGCGRLYTKKTSAYYRHCKKCPG